MMQSTITLIQIKNVQKQIGNKYGEGRGANKFAETVLQPKLSWRWTTFGFPGIFYGYESEDVGATFENHLKQLNITQKRTVKIFH